MAPNENTTNQQTNSSPNVYVGVQIELNKQVVDLIPETPINDIKNQGFKLRLASPVNLGTLKDALPSIFQDLGISGDNSLIKDGKLTSGVELIDKIGNKVLSANLTINALEYEKPPEEAKTNLTNTDSKYVFIASATWDDQSTTNSAETTKPSDFFKLRGIIVGVSKGYENKAAADNFLKIASQMNTTKQIAPANDNTTKSAPTKPEQK